jgi:hypothetical protein
LPFIQLPEGAEPNDDGRYEVDPSAIEFGDDETPDGFVAQESVDGIIETRLNRQKRSLRDNLKEDDDYWQEMATARGVEIREDGMPKGSTTDDELKELRQAASRAESLAAENEQFRAQIESARATQLENQVLRQADDVHGGAEDDLMAAVRRQVTFDDEYGWAATDEDGNVRYDAGEPVGPDQIVQELREAKPYFFRSRAASDGPSDAPSQSGSGKKTWTRAEHESAAKRTHEMDEATFQDWQSAPQEGRVTD